MKHDSSRAQRRWIWALMRDDRGRYALLAAGDSLGATLYVAYALLSRELIDGAVGRDARQVVTYAAWLVGLVLVRVGLNLWMRRLTLDLRHRWAIRLRGRLFRTLMSKEYAALNRYHSGVLQERLFTDVDTVVGNAVDLLPDLLSMLAGTLAALLSLYWLNAWIPAILLLMGALFVVVRKLFKGRIKAHQARMRDADSDRRAYYQEALENLLILKGFAAEDAAARRATGYEERSYGIWRTWFRYRQLLSGGVNLFFSMGELGAMALCAFLIMADRLTYGSMAAMLQLVAQVQAPFSDSFSQATAYATMLASADRLMELEALPTEALPEARDCAALYRRMEALRVENASFGYREDAPVLQGASAELRKGEFVRIVGESGVGKSTLLKLMLGVYPASSGAARLLLEGGESVALDASTRPLFAYVPQGNLLFSGSIRDNLTFLCGERPDAEIMEALRVACADAFVAETADGLETRLEEGGRGLSEGQAQRLAIARALLCDAPILLLDEATSALDEETEARMLRHLRALRDRTVLLISHRKTLRELCDHEWQLKDGAILERTLRRD